MKQISKNLKSTAVMALMLTAVFSAGYLAGRKLPAEQAEIVRPAEKEGFDLQLPGETEKMVVTVNEVEAKILEIGELTSCEGAYTVTKGEDFTRLLDDIPIPGTTSRIELTCSGIVKAGYDLRDVEIRVDNGSQTIYVSLPDAKINSNELLWNSNMLCNEENNILNPNNYERYQTMLASIKEEGLQQAERNGLYQTVEENAKKLITNFLGCFVDYKVEFM